MKFFLLLLTGISLSFSLTAQSGHHIEVTADAYEQEVLYLAYYYGNKQYVADTAKRKTDGSFVFEGNEPLEPGNYFLVFAPDNKTFEFLIDKNEQNFSLALQMENMLETVKITGSSGENELFFEYIQFLSEQRATVNALQSEESGGSNDSTDDEQTRKQKINEISAEVEAYQNRLVREHPDSFTALLLKSSKSVEYPEFAGTEEEVRSKKFSYAQAHYLDHVDLNDDRLVRTALLHNKLDFFVNKLHPNHPDSLINAIDKVISQMNPEGANYQYTVINFLNQFAKSRIIGMDAVYVHLAEKYYGSGKAHWSDEANTVKIMSNASSLKPLLIGKTAPNPALLDREGNTFNLHDVSAEYTILYFWRYDCEACKKSTPQLDAFFKKFKDHGVNVLAVCTKESSQSSGCWDYVDAYPLNDWVHGTLTNRQNNAAKAFMATSTPLIYLLDKDKVIISKRIAPDQLEDLFTNWLK